MSSYFSDVETESESENENNGENGDKIREIREIAQNYSNVRNKNDEFEFGFEAIQNRNQPRGKVTAQKPNKKRPYTNSTQTTGSSKSTKKKKINNSNVRPGVTSGDDVEVVPSTSTNEIVIVNNEISGDNRAQHESAENDTSLWKSRKFSNTAHLANYFEKSATYNNNKIDVICKLCPLNIKPLSITIGNNSNLMNHLRAVSFLLLFCWERECHLNFFINSILSVGQHTYM